MPDPLPSPFPPAAPPPPDLRWSGLTHRGRVRANNEDAFIGLAVDGHAANHLGKTGESSLASVDLVFAVSDGMGGAHAGEFASRIVVDRVTRLLPRSFRLAAAGIDRDFHGILGELVSATHRDLLHLGYSYEECAGMGATLSLAWFTPGLMWFAHLGDSRIYHLPVDGGLVQITHDHSQVGRLRRAGRIDERAARSHHSRHILDQVLGGTDHAIEPHLGAVAWRPGDTFVICSDGVMDGLWDRAIEEQVRAPVGSRAEQPPAQRLVEEAVLHSGRDNATAIVVELTATAQT